MTTVLDLEQTVTTNRSPATIPNPPTAENRWDETIANSLNQVFSSNAQIPTMRIYRPYYPLMPLPINKPICACRDYNEYRWNKTLIRYERSFSNRKYEVCYQILGELITLEGLLRTQITRQNQYIKEHYEAAQCLYDAIVNRRCDLVKVAPQKQKQQHWIEQENPIQWRAK